MAEKDHIAYIVSRSRRAKRKKKEPPRSTAAESACSTFALYAAQRRFVLLDGRRVRIIGLILSENASMALRRRFGWSHGNGTTILASYEFIEDDGLAEPLPDAHDGVPVLALPETDRA